MCYINSNNFTYVLSLLTFCIANMCIIWVLSAQQAVTYLCLCESLSPNKTEVWRTEPKTFTNTPCTDIIGGTQNSSAKYLFSIYF